MTGKKPLGGRAYGSILHLPGSRRGPSDRGGDVAVSACAPRKLEASWLTNPLAACIVVDLGDAGPSDWAEVES